MNAKGLRVLSASIALALASALGYVAVHAAPSPKVIKIGAKRFEYTPGTLTLKKGEPVVFEFSSEDVVMGFNLPDFNLRADIVPDKVTRVEFTPNKTGTFVFLCDIFCGSGHEEMQGSVTVID